MKTNLLKNMLLAIVLCVGTVASAATNWDDYQFLGDGAGGGQYADKYKITYANAVNIQQPGWADEAGIYCTFPAGVSNCTVASAIDGAGVVLYLSAFTAQETAVTVTYAGGSETFSVYYADGDPDKNTTGGDTTEPAKAVNLALNKPVVAGYNNDNASVAVDGNLGTRWASGGTHWSAEKPDQGDDWMYVDLEDTYQIGNVRILFETAAPTDYDLLVSDDATNWTVIGTYTEQPNTGNTDNDWNVYNFTSANVSARYVKIFARQGYANLAWGISIWEFEVYEAIADNEKPVLTAAQIIETRWNTVTVSVTATDNIGVTACHVVDAANGIDGKYAVKDGVLTITGLTAATSYNFTVTALDDAGNESENSIQLSTTTPAHSTEPQTAAPVPTVPANLVLSIYSDAYETNVGYWFSDWGGGYAETKKAIDGDNYNYYTASNTNGYLGIILNASTNVSAMQYWHLDIWAEDDMSISIYPIEGSAPEIFHTVALTGQQWNSINLILDEDYPATAQWGQVIQIKLADTGGKTIAVDNIYFYRDPMEDDEAPTAVTASVATESFFSVTLACSANDNSGAVNFDIFNGNDKVATGGGASNATVNITVSGLQAGTNYTFSVVASDANGNTANAVTVQATTLAAPEAAPTPTAAADKVLSLFSDAYTFAPASLNSYNEGWWDNPTLDIVELAAGDEALLYSGRMTGMIGWQFAPIDATNFTKFHVDIYPLADVTLKIGPTYGGDDPNTDVYAEARNLTANKWNSIDLDLSGKNLSSMFQLQFTEYSATSAMFVDNVYFCKPEGSGTQLVESYEPFVRLTCGKGQLDITLSESANIQVFNLLGVCLYNQKAQQATVSLPAGTYIVKAGNSAQKVIVR